MVSELENQSTVIQTFGNVPMISQLENQSTVIQTFGNVPMISQLENQSTVIKTFGEVSMVSELENQSTVINVVLWCVATTGVPEWYLSWYTFKVSLGSSLITENFQS